MKKIHHLILLGVLIPLFSLAASVPKDTLRIYVSPSGNDGYPGTFRKPLKTISKALSFADSQMNRPGGVVEIFLRKGTYYQSQTLEIGASSSSSQLRIAPYQNEKVSITGGIEISRKQIRNVSDPAILKRLPVSSRSHVLEINLENTDIELADLRASGFGRPSSAAWTEIFLDEAPLRLSRWPNDSTVLIGEVLEAGTGEYRSDAKLPVFKYNERHPDRWHGVEDFWISGYFAHGYADDMIRVSKIDTLTKTIHPAQQTVYGFMTGAPWRQWFALNLPEELDMPGEYVLDVKSRKVYFYPPQKEFRSLHLSVLGNPLVAIENRSDVILEGICFEYGRDMGVYMENTHRVILKNCIVRNMGGVGVCIGRGSFTPNKVALKPHAAEAGGEPTSRVIGDLIGKVYQDILFNRNGGTENGVVNCQIYQVGAGGVSLGGGDRESLSPAGNYVRNCRIHDYNRVEKSYRPGIWMDGVGNLISQCDIFNAPSMAILFHGNDHVIEYCKITNVCTEVDDQGAIYYGRDPSERGNEIRYCYFKELSPRHRVTATYHDDGACGARVYGNIYHRAGSLPVLIGGGHDNEYKHNIFIESPVAIHIDNRMQGWGKGMVASDGIIKQRLERVKYDQSPYKDAYPELVAYWEETPDYPKRNLFEGNLFYKIGNLMSGQTQWGEFRNNWITNTDPGFVDAENPLEGFKADAAIFNTIPGFPVIPFEKIGCTLPNK